MIDRDTLLPFLLIGAGFIIAEILVRHRSGAGYDFGAMGSSLFIMVGQQIINPLLNYAAMGAVLLGAHSLAPFSFEMGDWRYWLGAFFIVECAYYWQHRFSHTIRWAWATHAVHHSPNELALPSAFRLGWTGLVSGSWLVYVVPALMGVPPVMIIAILVVNLRFQFFLHTDLVGRLGPLEWLFNTPSNHRVHHSSQPEHLDKNFGGVLMIFDHIFGTYAPETVETPVVYGLTEPIQSNNPFVILFREWRHIFRDIRLAPTLGGRFRAAFGRPGEIEHKPASPHLLPAE